MYWNNIFCFYMSPSPSPRSKCSLYVDLKGISISLLKQLSEWLINEISQLFVEVHC